MIPTTLIAAPDDPAAFPESVAGYFLAERDAREVMVADDGKSSGGASSWLRRLGFDIAHLLEAPSKSGNLSKIHAFRLLLKEVTAS
jgi:hypothetical protein